MLSNAACSIITAMDSPTQQGYLLLADISGFTSFLAKSELDHALGILSNLLEVTTGALQPLFTISKLEGDAVFACAPASRVERGETVLEVVESTYVAFRRRLDAVHRRTTCECNACRNIPSLDLKFVAHFGEYGLQSVAVWEWLNDSRKRERWARAEVKPVLQPGGRTKQGARNHCVHGKSTIVEDVLDWRPFDYFTVDGTTPMGTIRTTYVLTPYGYGAGTKLTDHSRLLPRSPLLKPFAKPMLKLVCKMIHADQQYRTMAQEMKDADRQTRATMQNR